MNHIYQDDGKLPFDSNCTVCGGKARDCVHDMGSIYELLKAAGVPLDNHESDLYAQRTPESERILAEYRYRGNVRTFTSQIDGKAWFDIPFAFNPWWESRKPKQATP